MHIFIEKKKKTLRESNLLNMIFTKLNFITKTLKKLLEEISFAAVASEKHNIPSNSIIGF